ncbi:MAG TPA: hypothetical protein VN873_02470 [Candidatus Angelobacter sp.]|nr:hypothetical protein [Candidatus Angelobacter sp.]
MSDKLDQAEVVARINTLTLKAKYLAAELEMATRERVPLPSPSGDILVDLDTMEAHCRELETKLGHSPATTSEDFQPRRSSPGFASPSVLSVAHTGAAKLTATEQVLAAKGVSSLEELRQQRLQQSQVPRYPKTIDPKILNNPNMTVTEKCLAAKRQQQNR